MHLIHVHGFSEASPESKYTEGYRRQLQKHFPDIRVEEFKWNTLDADLPRIAYQFSESERRTKEAAERLAEVIESCKEPLILSGFSLGAAVVLRSLILRGHYTDLLAVILLGAAIPSSTRPPQAKGNDGCLRINYYSRRMDEVLRQAYYNAMGVPAAGSVGLEEPMGFQNLATGCRHIQINPVKDLSYWRLVCPVSKLIAWKQGIHGPGKAQKPWQPWAIGKMPDWDDIYRFRGYFIQQHFMTKRFRAIEEGGVHREECWSDEIWPVLDRINAKRQ